ncbi:MAG TPA: TIGR03986 family CRISPR-associated RAMP protein [Pseudonocardiaceae bacterium]|jgi:CRISPR-associated protein (TIGR03986 family)|nr:TIGR03986 family CRISPR-associated RAMP protein [Pseudonocardiaceae bacterium]
MTFYNPYNFVPALRRDKAPAGLGDGPPAGHDRWHPQLWSGRIAVRMTTISPLLLVTQDQDGDPPGHRRLVVSTVVDRDGTQRVDLAPTQIKGMLRTAFEAVTNSRFGVVSKDHHQPLGYRSDVSSGSGLRPVIVEQVAGEPRVTILGDLRPGTGLDPVPGAVLEAWQHPSRETRTATAALNHVHHRQYVEATLVGETITTSSGTRMCRWRVTEVLPVGATLPQRPAGTEPWARVRGYLHLTGPTIDAKRWERLFVTDLLNGSKGVTLDGPRQLSVRESAELLGKLRQLVEHQRGINTGADRDEIWHREHPTGTPRMPWEFFGHEPGSTAWSRHLYDVTQRPEGAPADPAPGWTGDDLAPTQTPRSGVAYTCWAETKGGRDRLRPVMVSRLLYDRSPFDLLHPSLRPAESLAELSPAERVFGWVAPRGSPRGPRRAHRSQVRVVKLTTPPAEDAVTHHRTDSKILPALSSPKPSQGRFYLGEDRNGPQPLRLARENFFGQQQTLRGRKVYLYRRGTRSDQVTPSGTDYDCERTTQNSTLHSWVKAGVQFGFELAVDNLTDLELGALLWLLDPQRLGRDGHPGRHRLGMGKPYGFGVVELSLAEEGTTLGRGDRIAQRLSTLDPAPADDLTWTELAARFEDAVGGPLAPVLRAVRAVAAGVGKDSKVHYPRSRPDDDGYTWFVEEEKRASKASPQTQALPPLEAPSGPGTLREHG